MVEYGRRTIRDLHHWLRVVDMDEKENRAGKDQTSPVRSREELAVMAGSRLEKIPCSTPGLETLVRYRSRLPSLSNSLYPIGVRGWWSSFMERSLNLGYKISLLLHVVLFGAL